MGRAGDRMGSTASPIARATAQADAGILRDVRDAPSYQLAMLASLNDRKGQAEFAAAFGISLGEWRALANIFILAPVSLVELARAMLLDKGQLSRTVRRLATRRWVATRPAPENRRAVLLTLTSAGRTKHDALLRFANARNESTMSVLTPDERRQFVACLRKLRAHTEAEFAALSEHLARKPRHVARRDGRRDFADLEIGSGTK
ncbi:MarR family winged helix-turn-helix transcriptional regulator [Desertibaculum subflavum]|uniref:MarR family winged helix-turn-helix transcriptional regulator n=1 Tax=Desertibaculum subflavum TaxID=2268458 RepID=UPI000E66CF3A